MSMNGLKMVGNKHQADTVQYSSRTQVCTEKNQVTYESLILPFTASRCKRQC